jgi:hypothetical protein
VPLLHAALISAALSLPRHAVFGAAVTDKPPGVTVTRVMPDGAAAAAGVATGDIIVSLAGVAVPNVAACLAEVHALHGGQTVRALIVRQGMPLDLTVALKSAPDESDPQVTTSYGAVKIDGALRRTFATTPIGAASPRPAVLFVGGIGCYSLDVATDPQDPYLRLAHDLSRAGFVTMRLEKSGVGDSQGPPCATVDFASEEYGYAVALTALRADPHVDSQRIYLFGHGVGTIIAARLARTEEVAGIVAAETVGRDWLEYELRSGTYPVDAPYLRQLAALDLVAPWAVVNAPVLVIYGKSDFVTRETDHARIVAIVNQTHGDSATLREIDGMDHLLYRAESPGQYDSQLSSTVVSWLCARERCP